MLSFKGLVRVAILLCAIVFGFAGQPVAAEGYGRDTYGSCEYGRSCGSNTVITTPKGLEIAINLTNGQVIPRAGYVITITPLNGTGSSFRSADIYIDSVLRGATQPGQNGTATWFWDVEKYPGTQVRVVVFDTDGGTITQDFTVSIEAEGKGGLIPVFNGGVPRTSDGQPQGGLITTLQELMRQVPTYVITVFPWLLFLLLLIEIVLLIWQTRREMKELSTLQGLIERERNIATLKTVLMQLVSHYLRTPFTLLKSGTDGIEKYPILPDIARRIQRVVDGLGASIEGLIAQVHDQAVQQSSAPMAVLDKHYARQRVIVWLPVGLIAAIVTAFTWLAYSVQRLSGGFITVLIYACAFIVLAIGVWMISSRLYLKKRDAQNRRAVLGEAVAMQASRDEFIRNAATVLGGYVGELRECSPSIPPEAPLARFVVEGIDRLDAVQNKFAIATQLQGSRSNDEYRRIPLRTLYEQAVAMLGTAADAKQIKLNLTSDTDLIIQNEKLMVMVLRSLLDNAIAYSSEGGQVSVGGDATKDAAKISVLDSGVGIEKDKLDMLFQPFSKVEGAETFNHEGMGFSLYLDKLIMAYLGGDIDITSEPQQKTEAKLIVSKHP
jgi:signal transduction histidine kinase